MYQPLLIATCFILPAFCLFKKKHNILIIWLSLVAMIDIFNSQKYMNLTAFKIAGLVLFPYVVFQGKTLLKSWSIRIYAIFIAYLLILGAYHGWINPWIDPTGLKAGRDVPQWRWIIHMGSLGLEFSCTLYLALQFREIKNILLSFKAIVFGGLISLFGGVLENIFNFDFYGWFTHSGNVLYKGRTKGFNYEPRGMAQSLAYAILVSLHLLKKFPKQAGISLAILLLGFLSMSVSFTGILILFFGALIPLAYLAKDKTKAVAIGAITILVLLTGYHFAAGENSRITKLQKHISERLYIFESGDIPSRLEVFDAAAMNFLLKNPKYILLGTGPGLISTPIGREYVLEKDRGLWKDGVVALPHMGGILILSNGGILGLLIWVASLIFGIKSMLEKYQKKEKDKLIYLLIGLAVLNISLLYLIQIRYIFYLAQAMLFGLSLKQKIISEDQEFPDK